MLPQRRKSAEEIAKLREAMGLPGFEAEPEPEPNQPGPTGNAPNPEEAQALFDQDPRPPVSQPTAVQAQPAPAPAEPLPPKRVKSLRKSERAPLTPEQKARRAAAAADVSIPVLKHSEQDLMKLRAQTATPADQSLSMVNRMAAPLLAVIGMYLLSIVALLAGWLSIYLNKVPAMDFPAQWIADIFNSESAPEAGKWIMIVLCGFALGIAGWIALKKPRSRHHAGFVTIIVVLVLAFGIIYHQPLPHGP